MKPRVVYDKVCIVCERKYQAHTKNSKCCSANCRVALSNKKRLEKAIVNAGGISEQQKELLTVQEKRVSEVVKKEIPVISNVVGKDLSECKRPDGKHLYTELDILIMMARIIRCVFKHDISNPITILGGEQPDNIIADFERRFQCKFSDIKKANPNIKPANNDAGNAAIMNKYAHLNYSR
jgi:hypothetical protein